MIVRLLDPAPILLDDPVRPSIPPEMRVRKRASTFLYIDDQDLTVGAVICTLCSKFIPTSEKNLFDLTENSFEEDYIVLYSIWSYKKGAGRKLVMEINDYYKNISQKLRIVTMSPNTTMARDFHLRNGAKVLQENEETVNYEY